MQVTVEGDDDLPSRSFKTREDSHMLAIVAVETNDFDHWMELIQPLQEFCRVIGTAVVDEDHLVALTHPMQGAHQPVSQLFERRCLVQDGHDDGEIDALAAPSLLWPIREQPSSPLMSDEMTCLWRDQAQNALVCRSICHEKDAVATLPESRGLLSAQEDPLRLGKT